MPLSISGGTIVYAKTQKGIMPMSIKDMLKLDRDTVRIWSGEAWDELKEHKAAEAVLNRKNESLRRALAKYRGKTLPIMGDIEIELRSGEKIGFTRKSSLKTTGGVKEAWEIKIGDELVGCTIPEPSNPETPEFIANEIGWLVGIYLAEGSCSYRENGKNQIQISGHVHETERLERLKHIAKACHGTCSSTYRKESRGMCAVLSGSIMSGIIDCYVEGEHANTKCLRTKCWQRSNEFLKYILDGYLHGDGHDEIANNRWKLDFCRNPTLAMNLRVLSARLCSSIRLKPYVRESSFKNESRYGYRGELKINKTTRRTSDLEVVNITQSGARHFWTINNHIALASGIVLV